MSKNDRNRVSRTGDVVRALNAIPGMPEVRDADAIINKIASSIVAYENAIENGGSEQVVESARVALWKASFSLYDKASNSESVISVAKCLSTVTTNQDVCEEIIDQGNTVARGSAIENDVTSILKDKRGVDIDSIEAENIISDISYGITRCEGYAENGLSKLLASEKASFGKDCDKLYSKISSRESMMAVTKGLMQLSQDSIVNKVIADTYHSRLQTLTKSKITEVLKDKPGMSEVKGADGVIDKISSSMVAYENSLTNGDSEQVVTSARHSLCQDVGRLYGTISNPKDMIAIAKSLSAVTANDIMRDTITSQADVAIRQSAIKRDIISLLTDKHGIPAIGSISGGNGLINHIAYNIIGCELQSRSSHSTLLASEKGKLGKNCDLLYDKISRTKDVMAVAKDIANVTKNEAAQAVISESATRRCDEIKSGLSFNDKGSLAKFLNSGSPKNLAAEIDRNMKNNHLLLDADLSKDKKAAEYLPENMRRQMEEVGKELQVRLDERATFSGKIKQKAENFAATVVNLPAIVINSLRKLVHLGEESLLSSACQECHYKVHGINLDLNRESQKPSGKFADAEVAKKSQLQTTHHEK